MKQSTFYPIYIIVILSLAFGCIYNLGRKIESQNKIIEEHKTDMITFEKNLKDGFARACVAHGLAEYDKKSGELYFVNECEEGCPDCGEEYLWKALMDSIPRLPQVAMEKVNE